MEKNIRQKLILSADDFGLSPAANTAILSLLRLGKIDRVAVMIEEHFTPKEIAELKNSGMRIDLHLNLPLGVKINNHTYRESSLKRSFIFLLKFFLGQISPAKMEKEWEAQIKKFVKIFDRQPDGLNSHQHIHYFPPYFKVLLRLAKKYDITFVRFGSKNMLDSNNTVYRILKRLRQKNQRAFRASSLQSSDYMASLDWIKHFPKFLETLPEGTTELVCHPERKPEFEILKKNF